LPNNVSTAEGLNKYFLTQSPFKESDIDLFLYGDGSKATVRMLMCSLKNGRWTIFTKWFQGIYVKENQVISLLLQKVLLP
jgi:hypothetical protein